MIITTIMMCIYKEEYDKQESEWHGEPDLLLPLRKIYVLCFCDIDGVSVFCLNGTVYTHGSVTGQPESLSHPGELIFWNCRGSYTREKFSFVGDFRLFQTS
ncbi:unnamed protein product [Eruca vesicaria subsp. sativa]|uniref:Uncharacterized protein n=1 Tax=Eruca vesicaria subsp. sativa TaxID=29727 RepID=A0ABC8J5V2_ERUVS|nr:unnamed protein product [Eruca vesicaria subsp. sativa]